MKVSPYCERRPNFKRVSHTCPQCGEEFLGARHETLCSVKCAHERDKKFRRLRKERLANNGK